MVSFNTFVNLDGLTYFVTVGQVDGSWHVISATLNDEAVYVLPRFERAVLDKIGPIQ